MAPPAPSRNFEQNSPITTVLKNICNSYPESSCLRELLQNADDAEASEIEYILDTKSYNEVPLIHEGLKQYHGPALLARNNSVFTDKDFESLAKIGDSGKQDDPASTGKFGQGFSSCYHWTDGPWILSRQWLLFLDPHRDWSGECGRSGGPAYDIVKCQDSIEVQNHLKAFQSAKLDTSKAVDGTVIRIPLRTEAQAKKSKIVDRAISIDAIAKALHELGQEIREGGMIFLRHVQTVTARIDDTVLWKAQIVGATVEDTRVMRSVPESFKEVYAPRSNKGKPEMLSRAFKININFSQEFSSSVHSFFVHHRMTTLSSNTVLDEWAHKRKLHPWVAIAAPLHSSQDELPRGHLFSCLRMPTETNQPVHIHGLFSIAPDRSRLSSSDQASDDLGGEWNRLMFDKCVSVAWTDLLASRSLVAWSQECFAWWPRINISDSREPWSSLDDLVIDRMIAQNLPVWNTPTCCVTLQDGFFAPQGDDVQMYGQAFRSISLPLVCLEPCLYDKLCQRATSLAKHVRTITPRSLRGFLRDNDQGQGWREHSPLLLQYCLLDCIQDVTDAGMQARIYDELRNIRLWPTLHKIIVALEGTPLFLPRDSVEAELFEASRSSETLDLGSLTPQVFAFLQRCAEHHSTFVRHRKLSDLEIDWEFIYPIKSPSSQITVLPRNSKNDPTITDVWSWICNRCKDESEPLVTSTKVLDNLFLVPLNGDRIRRFAFGDRTCPALVVQDEDWIHDLLEDRVMKDTHSLNFVLDSKALPVKATKLLQSIASKRQDLGFATPSDLRTLLIWLATNKDSIKDHAVQHKTLLVQQLRILTEQKSGFLDEASRAVMKQQILGLPIFNQAYALAPYKERQNRRVGIGKSSRAVQIVESLPPMPNVPGLTFYEPSSQHEQYLVDYFDLLEKISSDELIFEHLMPSLEEKADSVAAEVKLDFVNFALETNLRPSANWKARFCSMKLVPKAPLPGVRGLQFRSLTQTIDPTSSLGDVFFEDEDVFLEPKFFERHRDVLIACGIVRELTPQILLEHAQTLASSPKDPERLRVKVKHILSLPISTAFDLPAASLSVIRSLKWLPVSGPWFDGLQLMSPAECRAADEKELVDLVLGVFGGYITNEWKRLLGWDQVIETTVLTQQLNKALAAGLGGHVDRVLTYLSRLEDCSFLKQIPCIHSSRGEYILPERSFLHGGLLSRYPLAPYLDEVEPSFARKHQKLLSALDIRQDMTYDDVLDVQGKLLGNTHSNQLSDVDLGVCLALLEIATHPESKTEDLSALLIPDTESKLRHRTDIVHGDRNVTGEIASFNFVHPKISPYLIRCLDLETSFDRAIRLGIEFEDQEEDEYTPHEKLTTIISDTLGRYPIDSTFGEFLANANDCGATRISWILDECAGGPHKSTTLISRELEVLQGPALFVHNDQVFEEKDFDGFKEIGRGGKTDDAATTGMFGRGVMTMYHFTDVPMLISESFFLILDPQQELLPRNKHGKRKAGIKIPLAIARRMFSDQLRPFDGLHGYSIELDHYDGTLFRLPLRPTERTLLTETSAHIDIEQAKTLLEEYYSTAQMSLLFLSNIKAIDFSIRGRAAVWSVKADRSGGSFREVFENVSIESLHECGENYNTTWRVCRQNIDEAPEGTQKPGKGADKFTECGLAACIESSGRSPGKGNTQQRVFCTLPTLFLSGLPVSVHATFAITGDRKTIPFEDFVKETPVKKWNRWLLTECIPDLYIEFLKDLASKVGQNSFRFWPSKPIPRSDQSIGRLVHEAFWTLLASPSYESYQLYPLVDTSQSSERSTPLKTRAGVNARKLSRVTSLKSAQFDVLPTDVSKKLRPLFCKLCPNLVYPPKELWRAMTAAKIRHQTTALESGYLCALFMNESNCDTLEDFLRLPAVNDKWDAVVEMILRITIPVTSADSKQSIEAVNACRIIPKLNQTLGTVKFRSKESSPFPQDDLLFLPTEEEAELFHDKARSLIKPNLFRKQADPIILLSESLAAKIEAPRNPLRDLMVELSNIREIGIGDIHTFLDPVHLSSAPVTSGAADKWVPQFWSYLKPRLAAFLRVESSEMSSASVTDVIKYLKLDNTRIYRYNDSGSWCYITPEQFEAGPYILLPSDEKQVELCKSLLDVKLIDPDCVPSQLRRTEPNLKISHAFSRLLRALGHIQGQQGRVLLKMHVKAESYELLRNLVSVFVKTKDVADYKDTLRFLKIWTGYRPWQSTAALTYVAAKDALLCADQAMLVPWIQDTDRFMDPYLISQYPSTLKILNCTVMTVQSAWQYAHPNLPGQLAADQLPAYLRCIECLASHNCKPTSVSAPDGFGTMCSPSALFDHEDDLFRAAFRKSEGSHFIHSQFRSQRLYWRSLGLRSRSQVGAVDVADFLECVRMIVQRLSLQSSNSPEDLPDAQKVTAYLRYSHPNSQYWPDSAWATITQAKMYPTERDVSALSLHIAEYECWTLQTRQGSVALTTPLQGLIYAYYGVNVHFYQIHRHLQCTKNIKNDLQDSDLSEYLKDIQATYTYLQDHRTATVSISGIREAKVWLNLPTTELTSISSSQLDNALRSARSLCFNAPLDTHTMERAKNFLVPYESILRALGCHTIVQPPRAPVAPPSNQRPMDHILASIRVMREQGQLVDVTFEAEGVRVPANQTFMAAASDLWRTRFLGEWARGLDAKPNIEVGVNLETSLRTLRYLVDFAYAGEVKWPGLKNAEDVEEVDDTLDELLHLLKGANMWRMETLHDLTERHLLDMSAVFVRPDNVENVRDLTEEANAKRFAAHCEEFRIANEQFVEDCKVMR